MHARAAPANQQSTVAAVCRVHAPPSLYKHDAIIRTRSPPLSFAAVLLCVDALGVLLALSLQVGALAYVSFHVSAR